MSTERPEAQEVFFDGACPVCRREIAAYRRMPGLADLNWVDVSDPATDCAGIDRAAALARFHVRRRDGSVVTGARAFLAVWRCNPRLAPLARILDRRPVCDLLELLYRGFLRVRPLWRRGV